MRDINTLEFAGVPIYYDRQLASYRIREGYRITVPSLTQDEIIGQSLASKLAQAAGIDVDNGVGAATEKIAASVSHADRDLLADAQAIIDVLGLQFADHSGCKAMIRICQQALIESCQLFGTYHSPYQPGPISLTLNPIRLCLIKTAWYLIATPVDAGETRTYRVARFTSLQPTDSPAASADNFDLQDYLGNAWAVFRGSETYDVSIRFNPTAAKIVTETTWHRTQRADASDDGSVILHFTVDGLDEICEWLLTWTGQAEVLAPQQLRTMLFQRLQAGLQLNDSP